MFGFVIYQLFSLNHKTDQNVESVKDAVVRLEHDHDGQDELLQCIVNLFLEKREITRIDVDNCVIETSVPPPQTSQDEEFSSPTGGPSQTGGSVSPSSSSNSTPPNQSPQPNNSQSQPEEPEEPDNDGVIINLPLLPEIHIPSPL